MEVNPRVARNNTRPAAAIASR